MGSYELWLDALADYTWPDLPPRGGSRREENLEAAARAYVRGRLKRNEINRRTAEQATSRIRSFTDMAPRDPRKVTKRHVLKWIESAPDLSPSYRRGRLSTLRHFTAWCVEERIMSKDPCAGVPLPRVRLGLPRRLTEDEARRVVVACPDKRTRAIVLLALHTGLRRAELAALDVTDLDWGAKSVMRIRGKGFDGMVSASLPIPNEGWRALVAYLAESGHTTGALFRNLTRKGDGGRISPGHLSELVRRAMVDAGVKAPGDTLRTPHSLRHTAAHDVLVRTGSLHLTMQMMRHANMTTTQRYTRLVDLGGALREGMEGRTYTTS